MQNIHSLNAKLENHNVSLRNEVKKVAALSKKRNQRFEDYQTKMSTHFSPAGATEELTGFVSNQTGLSRFDFADELWYQKNSDAASLLFCCDSFKETILRIEAFFTDVDSKFPLLCCENKKIKLKPSHLTSAEQIFIA